MIRVPRVARLARFVAAVRQHLAQKPVVLDVVSLGESVPRIEMMDRQKRRNDPAKNADERNRDAHGQEPRQQYGVVPGEGGMPQFRQSIAFVVPAALEGSGYLAADKFIDALAHPGAGAILGCCDMHMMTDVMLDAKMSVTHQAIRDLSGDAVGAIVLMTEFVAQQYGTAALKACTQREHYISPDGHAVGAEKPSHAKETGK